MQPLLKRMGRFLLPAGCAVLLTGATGFTGMNLVRNLTSQRINVRAIVRPGPATRKLESLGVQCFEGKIDDRVMIRDAAHGVQYVFHLASPYRSPETPDSVHAAVHVNATRELAMAAAAQPDFQRFVHVSTIGVHGHVELPPADETYRFAPGDSYQTTKLEGEQWLMAFGRESGLPVVVVRPAAIYGPGDLRLSKLFRMSTQPMVPIIGNGRGLYHLIHVDDLTRFLLLAARHPAATGEAFICGNREPIRIIDMILQAGSVYGVKPRFVRLPVSPVMALARLCEAVCKPLGIRPPLYPRRVAFFTKDRAFDASKMTRLLGFVPERSNEQGIAETARWYADNGMITVPNRKPA